MRWLSQVHSKRKDYKELLAAGCRDGDFVLVDGRKNTRGGKEVESVGGSCEVYPLKVIYNELENSYHVSMVVVGEDQEVSLAWFEAKANSKSLVERWRDVSMKGGGWYRLEKMLVGAINVWTFEVQEVVGDRCGVLTSKLLDFVGQDAGSLLRPFLPKQRGERQTLTLVLE